MEIDVLKTIDRMIDKRWVAKADVFTRPDVFKDLIAEMNEELYALYAARQALEEQKTRVNC